MLNKHFAHVLMVLVILMLGLLFLVHYYVSHHGLLAQAYNGSLTEKWNFWVQKIYPRIETERARLPFSFFENKWDQLLNRGLFIGLSSLVVITLLAYWKPLHNRINNQLTPALSVETTNTIRVLFYLGIIITTWDWFGDFSRMDALSPFFKPIGWIRLLHSELPSNAWLITCYITMGISCFGAAFNLIPKITGTLGLLIFIYLQGIFLSFEKIDHTYATYIYGGLGLVCMLWDKKEKATQWVWLIQALLCGAYFFAGTEKLFTSGVSWLSSENLAQHLIIHGTPAGLWVAKQTWLCLVLNVVSLSFQLTFWVVLFFPKTKKYYLILACLFHFGTVFLLGISSYLNPWVMALLFFIDWGSLPVFTKKMEEAAHQHSH